MLDFLTFILIRYTILAFNDFKLFNLVVNVAATY